MSWTSSSDHSPTLNLLEPGSLVCDLKLFSASSKLHWCCSTAVGRPPSQLLQHRSQLLLISWPKVSLLLLKESVDFRVNSGLLSEKHCTVTSRGAQCMPLCDLVCYAVNILSMMSTELFPHSRTEAVPQSFSLLRLFTVRNTADSLCTRRLYTGWRWIRLWLPQRRERWWADVGIQ